MTLQVERSIQQEVMWQLALGGWPVAALPHPNGIWIPARNDLERVVVARIISRMKSDGQLVPGAPDLSLHWRGGSAMIELKRPKTRDLLTVRPAGRLNEEQERMRERAMFLGIPYEVVTSWGELKDKLGEWGVGR